MIYLLVKVFFSGFPFRAAVLLLLVKNTRNNFFVVRFRKPRSKRNLFPGRPHRHHYLPQNKVFYLILCYLQIHSCFSGYCHFPDLFFQRKSIVENIFGSTVSYYTFCGGRNIFQAELLNHIQMLAACSSSCECVYSVWSSTLMGGLKPHLISSKAVNCTEN